MSGRRRGSAWLLCLLTAVSLLFGGCGKKQEAADLRGTDLALSASSNYYDDAGNEILSYQLIRAVMQKDGNIVFVHSFTNHSDYRVTRIVAEFYYYSADGATIAHRRLTRQLSETPIAPGGTYTYFSTNNFDGVVPSSMEALIVEGSTEQEVPVLTPPRTDSDLFTFFSDGRYSGLQTAFMSSAPVMLLVKRDGEDTMTVTEAQEIRAVFEALRKMHVGEKSGEQPPADSGVRYTFVTAKGTEYTVRFESRRLIEYGGSLYEITDDGGLFDLRLTEAVYSQEDGSDILQEPEE